MKDSKKYLISSIILVTIAVVFTMLVKCVDVGAIGPDGSKVGFQAINDFLKNLFPFNSTMYKITKYAGFIPIILGVFYAFTALMQLIKTKSIKKVDKRLIALGVFYVVVLAVYVLFEKVVINYRPVIIDVKEGLEASYPSSHTVLALCFCASSLMISKYYFKDKTIRKIVDIITWLLMVFIVLGRIIAGCHWIRDIFGGIIISLALLNILYMVLIKLDEKKAKK